MKRIEKKVIKFHSEGLNDIEISNKIRGYREYPSRQVILNIRKKFGLPKNYKTTQKQRDSSMKSQIKKLIEKYDLDEIEARVILNTRISLCFMSPELVSELEYEMQQNEGLTFTEMVMDGIPNRKRKEKESRIGNDISRKGE